ncbi:hypothetical protein CPB86DRAFT_714806 [Serendipita vermifera]|nr:hypothetical protein CPB86DRAFT_714806 [Serendipita vermifera]
MNNVRRLFGGASGSTTTAVEQPITPYDTSTGTNWVPQANQGFSGFSGQPIAPPKSNRTPSPPPPVPKLALKQQLSGPTDFPKRQNSNPLSPEDNRAPSRRTNSTSSGHSHSPSTTSRKGALGHSKALSSLSRTRINGAGSPPIPLPNAKDELIIELLASEAVVDSREFEILDAEKVEEFKKELKSLSGRLTAATKKLTLETKLRDAASSLNKVQEAHNRTPSKAGNLSALETANAKVQKAQQEVTNLSDRCNEIQKRLLEHRSAVLSYSLERLEAQLKPPAAGNVDSSGRTTPANGLTNDFSPTSAVTNMSSTFRPKFEGAHLFAGHSDAKAPPMPKVLRSVTEMNEMEEELASKEEALKAAQQQGEELRREAAALRNQKKEVENDFSAKLQEADTTISGLRAELQRMNSTSKRVRQLEDEKRKWEDERAQMDRDFKVIETSSVSREEIVRKDSEISLLRATLERERKQREDEKHAWEDEKLEDMARLQQEMEDIRADTKGADAELDMVAEQLQALIKTHNITLSPSQRRDMSIASLTAAISSHLSSMKDGAGGKDEWESARRVLERDLKASLDRRDKLSQEVEDARKEREAARKEIRTLEERIKVWYRDLELSERPYPMKSNSLNSDPGSSNGSRNSEDMDRVMSVLRQLWALLPSREARAARSMARSASPSSPLRTTGGRLGEPPSPSLADLDVRALKALYDPRNNASSPLFNNNSNPADFSIDAFAQKVQALVADDRAIIERLLRFAQSHELLKNNAERAQKLAQESSLGLETYQKQVKLLEDRNATMMMKQTDMLDEINKIQTELERAQREKRQLEMKATEQAINLQNLTDANSALSARALALAEEVSTAPETIRIKLEAQLSETRRQLKESMDELDAIRSSEQSQKAALLEELNVMQGENSKLRDQLRAEQRKNGGR